MIHGALYLALANTYLTAFSDSPTYLLSNSGPLTAIKFALDALATAYYIYYLLSINFYFC